jgi:hypothetical protein
MYTSKITKNKKKFITFGLATIGSNYIKECKRRIWHIKPRGNKMFLCIGRLNRNEIHIQPILLWNDIVSAEKIEGFNQFIKMMENENDEIDEISDKVKNDLNIC